MKINEICLPCLVNQAVRVAQMTNAPDRDQLYRAVFRALSEIDFAHTMNPEVIGAIFRLLREHIGVQDPYYGTRRYYNKLFLELSKTFRERIEEADNPFGAALRYAILGNIVDFNPIHNNSLESILRWFDGTADRTLAIDHSDRLREDAMQARTLLYIGDNCGEICLDQLLIRKLRELNPALEIYFAVRGAPVVNDSVEEDAYFVGMDRYAAIVSNGDDSLGTVLRRTNENFRRVWSGADIVLAKGQANYESLSEEEQNLYFLLVAKCGVIAEYIGVPEQSLVCLNRKPKTTEEPKGENW